tara:strand:+ start:3658 stop:3870 length:213 start_codon:yes stop_codon:yes gene_type:complete
MGGVGGGRGVEVEVRVFFGKVRNCGPDQPPLPRGLVLGVNAFVSEAAVVLEQVKRVLVPLGLVVEIEQTP